MMPWLALEPMKMFLSKCYAQCQTTKFTPSKMLMRDVSSVISNETNFLKFIHFIHLNRLISLFETVYGKSLENELSSETSGNFKRLLVSLCVGGRDESGIVDHDAANRDATELLRAGELRAGTDESTFNMVFCQRNFAQIKLVSFSQQHRIIGDDISMILMDFFSDLRKVSANDRPWFRESHSKRVQW